MLTELTVKNLALIDSLTISFGPGANILTGETGAGKSIVVGALGLLLGRRGPAELVRAGAEEAQVTGLFYLDEPQALAGLLQQADVEASDEILLKRVLSSAGRSRAYINGQAVTLSQLAVVGEALLSISGQHEQQSLLTPARQLDFLDSFGGHSESLAAMRSSWQNLKEAQEALAALTQRLGQAEEKRELYEFQRDEIARLAPRPGEDEELLAEKNAARHSGRLLERLQAAASLLGGEPGNVVEKLGRAKKQLEAALDYDQSLGEALAAAEDSYHRLADLALELENRTQNTGLDPGRLEQIEERLNALAKLKRKYNLSLAELVERGRHLAARLEELDGAALELARLRQKRQQALEKAQAEAQNLHRLRSSAAEKLAVELTETLRQLGFPKLSFQVTVEDISAEAQSLPGPAGLDRVCFMFRPNPGEAMLPLAKIASGGELSRVMLALKTVQSRPGEQLLIFDEIDSGLGGVTAEAVALKMASLARKQQLIIITHLPQMAALAGRHFVVLKQADEASGRTLSRLKLLEPGQRAAELARMLGGASASAQALALAEEMLAAAGSGL